MATLSNLQQVASCHKDINGENILYDGKQLYLIDFEASGLEDPYFDLATVCQQNCFNPQEEFIFLEQYLERKPNDLQLAKLYLMKQISYCYHALYFIDYDYNAGMMEFHHNVPTLKEWYQGRSEGKYSYNTTYELMLYGMVVVLQSLDDMAKPIFIEAMNLVKTGHLSQIL